ncbi:MAG: serine O-acetyltransferase EpsC [Lachnospirales bacterium]
MDLNQILNNEVTTIANELELLNHEYYLSKKIIGVAGKEKIKRIIHYYRSAIFPGVYERELIKESDINILIGNNIRIASIELYDILAYALAVFCTDEKNKEKCCARCKNKATEITYRLIKELPNIRRILQKDIEAAYLGDPAAVSHEEILLSYPSIEAVSIYRLAHFLYKEGVQLIPRVMSEYAHNKTGIDINAGAVIGEGFFIDHGTGVVIGETCIIGKNVKIYQGVTLGAKSFPLDEDGNPIKGIKRHPNIGDNVVIYAGATILGGETFIGSNSVIGSNVWLTKSVPENSNVYLPQGEVNIK